MLLQELEKKVDRRKYDKLILEASLGAVKFYERNGFVCKKYMEMELPDGIFLCYLEMAKQQCNEDEKQDCCSSGYC